MFLTMAAGGAAAAVFVHAVLGRVRGRRSVERLGGRLRVLAAVVLALVANTVLMAGSMMLTYLAPYLTETTEGPIDQRAVAFGLAGVAGVIGILAGGSRPTDGAPRELSRPKWAPSSYRWRCCGRCGR